MAAPLFLVAPPRSFTSIINAMLGQHPQMYGMPELNIFSADIMLHLWQPQLKEFFFSPTLRHGLLRAIAEIYAGEQTDEAVEFAEHWCAAREKKSTGEVFREICDKIHPLIPVDKSPSYTANSKRLESIIAEYPDARFIHLLRHPVKQCESSMAMGNLVFPNFINSIEYQEDKAIVEPQIAWHDININILNFLENKVPKDQYMSVRGEDIMEFPKENLGQICRWLGIRDDDLAIDSMMHSERSPFACFGPILALFGNDPNFLRRSAFKQHKPTIPSLYDPVSWRDDGKGLYPEVIGLAKEFGYE